MRPVICWFGYLGAQHARAAVLAALRARAGGVVAVALHHLHEVPRTGRDEGRRARPVDGDALVGDVLRLADRHRKVREFAVHERQRPRAGCRPVRVRVQLRAAVGAARAGDRLVARVQQAAVQFTVMAEAVDPTPVIWL